MSLSPKQLRQEYLLSKMEGALQKLKCASSQCFEEVNCPQTYPERKYPELHRAIRLLTRLIPN